MNSNTSAATVAGGSPAKTSGAHEAADSYEKQTERQVAPAYEAADEDEDDHDDHLTDPELGITRKQSRDPNVARFEPNDKDNPINWSLGFKIFATAQLTFMAFSASLASSIISPAIGHISQEFHISTQVGVFSVSLYVLGLGLGPMVWAGVSESFGRKPSLVPGMFGLSVFALGAGFSQNVWTLFILRFFSGLFGSSPVSNVAAALGDMYSAKQRGIAVSLYAVAVVGGPTLGPVIGSALTVKVTWRWTMWLIAIVAFAAAVFATLFLPEMYPPVILKRKAKKLRDAGQDHFYHPHEHSSFNLEEFVAKNVTRPIRFLLTEPIVTVVSLYASFVYALLFMTLEIFPIIYEDIRGWGPIVGSLPFVALLVGIFCALAINLGNIPFYNRAVDRNGGKPVPDARLPPMFIGALSFTLGLFWMAWTATPKYHWILPTIAAGFIGAGFNVIFQQCINVLVDSYTLYAASALAANTFLRSVLASALPFAIMPMYTSLGIGKAMSILGAFSAAAIPIPFVLIVYGKSLRRRSKFARE